jgi:CheY-like chemotaxis protein
MQLHARTVLVVEDSAVSQTVVQLMMLRRGWDVIVATGEGEAIGLFSERRFDLVLIDLQAVEADGFGPMMAMRHIEHDQKRAPTPIVALASHPMTGDRERCLVAGLTDCLAKPLTAAALYRVVDALQDHDRAA